MWVLQADYGCGQGWEDEIEEETKAEALQRLKEYRAECKNTPYKFRIKRL